MNPLSFLVEAVKLDSAIDLRKKRKIPAHAHVFARVNACSELADEDIAGPYGFAAEDFDAPSFPPLSRPFRELPPAFLCAIFHSLRLIPAKNPIAPRHKERKEKSAFLLKTWRASSPFDLAQGRLCAGHRFFNSVIQDSTKKISNLFG